MQNEDLEKLYKDFPKKKLWGKRLFTMLLNHKKKWKELGMPDYLMKYEIANKNEE